MGRIRTKDVKDIAKDFFNAYPGKFSKDFNENKEKLKDLGTLRSKSKHYRNCVAGYLVRVVRKNKVIG